MTATRFIESYPLYFTTQWDKIFNEFTIIDNEKKLFRIDRLMINTISKEILIIDYKTGQISDDEQVEYYIHLIRQLPIFTIEGYRISGEYCHVDLFSDLPSTSEGV